MAVVKELIRTEADGSISFGNHRLETKQKVEDFEHDGDQYKVKTFKTMTNRKRCQLPGGRRRGCTDHSRSDGRYRVCSLCGRSEHWRYEDQSGRQAESQCGAFRSRRS